MNIKECYAAMNADFNEVLKRFGNEKRVSKFAVRFLDDPSYDSLCEAFAANDSQGAFRAVHTLKGTCATLAFTELFSTASELTEKLRGNSIEGSEEIFEKLKGQYDITADILRRYQRESAEG